MFKSIIWATDGSESADLALPYVQDLATEGTKIVVVHVEEFVLGPRASGYTVYADEDDLKAKIERQVKELTERGHDVTHRLVRSAVGGAAHRIAEVAQDEAVDVIVVGTRGHTALGGLLLGSVTQRLLHIGVCPVLAVPAAAATTGDRRQAAHATAG